MTKRHVAPRPLPGLDSLAQCRSAWVVCRNRRFRAEGVTPISERRNGNNRIAHSQKAAADRWEKSVTVTSENNHEKDFARRRSNPVPVCWQLVRTGIPFRDLVRNRLCDRSSIWSARGHATGVGCHDRDHRSGIDHLVRSWWPRRHDEQWQRHQHADRPQWRHNVDADSRVIRPPAGRVVAQRWQSRPAAGIFPCQKAFR
jgi:hypothetical protein